MLLFTCAVHMRLIWVTLLFTCADLLELMWATLGCRCRRRLPALLARDRTRRSLPLQPRYPTATTGTRCIFTSHGRAYILLFVACALVQACFVGVDDNVCINNPFHQAAGRCQGSCKNTKEAADADLVDGFQDIENGLGNKLPTGRSRADAMYFGFTVFCNGLRVGHPRGVPGRISKILLELGDAREGAPRIFELT